MANPFLSLWDSEAEIHSTALEWAKNATLFAPSLEELAKRHIAHASYLLKRAREMNSLGHVTDAKSTFNNAIQQRDMARKCLDEHHVVVLRSR